MMAILKGWLTLKTCQLVDNGHCIAIRLRSSGGNVTRRWAQLG